MALNAFIKIGDANGEARQFKYGKEKWCEIQGWDWDVEAESSWTKGGGASVGKPNPGKFNFEHYYDRASPTILYYMCTGTAFPKVVLEMCKGTGKKDMPLEPFFIVTMKEVFITKVANTVSEDGNVVQKVEMVFKEVKIDYAMQGENPDKPSMLSPMVHFTWNIPEGKVV